MSNPQSAKASKPSDNKEDSDEQIQENQDVERPGQTDPGITDDELITFGFSHVLPLPQSPPNSTNSSLAVSPY